jgi:hypothetical protein
VGLTKVVVVAQVAPAGTDYQVQGDRALLHQLLVLGLRVVLVVQIQPE